MVALSVFAVADVATAELKPNEIAQSLNEAADAVTDLDDLGGRAGHRGAGDRRRRVTRPLARSTSRPPGDTAVVVPAAPTTTVAPTTTAPPGTAPTSWPSATR